MATTNIIDGVVSAQTSYGESVEILFAPNGDAITDSYGEKNKVLCSCGFDFNLLYFILMSEYDLVLFINVSQDFLGLRMRGKIYLGA